MFEHDGAHGNVCGATIGERDAAHFVRIPRQLLAKAYQAVELVIVVVRAMRMRVGGCHLPLVHGLGFHLVEGHISRYKVFDLQAIGLVLSASRAHFPPRQFDNWEGKQSEKGEDGVNLRKE